MSWLCRLGWRPRLRPAPVIRIIENWVYLVVVVERHPQRPMFDEWSNSKGNHPPKRLKRKRYRRRSRGGHSQYNHPY